MSTSFAGRFSHRRKVTGCPRWPRRAGRTRARLVRTLPPVAEGRPVSAAKNCAPGAAPVRAAAPAVAGESEAPDRPDGADGADEVVAAAGVPANGASVAFGAGSTVEGAVVATGRGAGCGGVGAAGSGGGGGGGGKAGGGGGGGGGGKFGGGGVVTVTATVVTSGTVTVVATVVGSRSRAPLPWPRAWAE
jgi:hypothetical protein